MFFLHARSASPLASVSSTKKHLRQTIRYHANHQPSKPFHYHDTQFKSRFRCTQLLRSNYAIIIVIYRRNHPPFPLNCYLYAKQTYRTYSPKLRLLLVIRKLSTSKRSLECYVSRKEAKEAWEKFSPVNLGILEAQHQTNCNRIVFNAI